jgi:hypothetical protein
VVVATGLLFCSSLEVDCSWSFLAPLYSSGSQNHVDRRMFGASPGSNRS